MIQLHPHPEGVVLAVRAQPGTRRAGVCGLHAGQLKVAVAQRAEKGKANKALLAELAQALSLRKSQLELLAGATSREKQFLVRGVEEPELRRRVSALLSGADGETRPPPRRGAP